MYVYLYINMFQFLSHFIRRNTNKKQVFGKEYRDGYNKLWINNLRHYQP